MQNGLGVGGGVGGSVEQAVLGICSACRCIVMLCMNSGNLYIVFSMADTD